jgi:hypothetical protein
MRSLLFITLLSAAGSVVQAQLFTPSEVQQYVDQALSQYHDYVTYAGPSDDWYQRNPLGGPKPKGRVDAAAQAASVSAEAVADQCSYWMENVKRQGVAAFNGNPSAYRVWRNVKDFGAKGDGQSDDTAAINAAISSGNRCAPGSCASSTVTPAVVYFPPGTYMISSSIIDYYYTQIIGNPKCLPVIKAFPNYKGGVGMIEADPYGSNGKLSYGSTNGDSTSLS